MSNKSEREKRVDNINQKLDSINQKMKEAAEVATNKGYDAKENLDTKLSDAKDEVENLKERYTKNVDKLKNKMSDELSFAHAKHELLKSNLQDIKEVHDRNKLAKYIDESLEYSDDCAELSLMFAAESKLAMLEAILAMEEYEEKYGDDSE